MRTITNSNSILRNEKDWDIKWKDIFDNYQKDNRHAYYIRALKRKEEKNILEIAAGSFRDMGALCKWGFSCNGVDYSSESISRAKLQFPNFKEKIHKMDAFNFDYKDDTFDLTFHNGFWGLYNNDEILRLAKEQARISKYRMIATVHNAHNNSFKLYFDKMKERDALYNVRFFQIDEITALMSSVCSKILVIPVGKSNKYHEDKIIKMGLAFPIVLKKYFKLSKHKLLEQSERLLCIGKL